MSDLTNLDIKKIKFKKSTDKAGEYKKSFIPFDIETERKCIISLKNVILPFGYELYNKKYILNMEIYPNKSNDHHNIYSILSAFERNFVDKTINDINLTNEVDGKGFYSNLKETIKGYMLRTFVYGHPEIFMMIKNFKSSLTSNDIKCTKCNVDLEFGVVWITENSYGLGWNVKKIEVVSSL